MGNKEKSTPGKERKRTIKYLANCKEPRAFRAVVHAAPDSVIKTICDAALNVQHGEGIHLNRKQKSLFRKHHDLINYLTSPKVSISKKRSRITKQTGGAFFIPALIGTALGALGSAIFGK